jgi:hypothetical protein
MQGAQDNGEFFTPPSLVQTIVNVIEPDHGIVFDPACGSGGMFVQSSHFIEQRGQSTAHRVTFYGQEKTATTIRLAKMNLAVHGLEGDIARPTPSTRRTPSPNGRRCGAGATSSWPTRPSTSTRSMPRKSRTTAACPSACPASTRTKKVSNGNYLWISYFWSYLNRHRPRRLRHVLAGQQRRPRRGRGAPQARRDRRRGRDDRHPLQLLLHPHRPLRALALRPRQAASAATGADARRAPSTARSRARSYDFSPSNWPTSRPSSGSTAATPRSPPAVRLSPHSWTASRPSKPCRKTNVKDLPTP